MGLSQSTLGGGFGPQPEYSGRRFWASARVLWERVLGLSQSTLGGGFGPDPVINSTVLDKLSRSHTVRSHTVMV